MKGPFLYRTFLYFSAHGHGILHHSPRVSTTARVGNLVSAKDHLDTYNIILGPFKLI